jgi:hypothetical protein
MVYVFSDWTVDPEFAQTAVRWAGGGLGPMLRLRGPSDRGEIHAVPSLPGWPYELVDPRVDLEKLLRRTWREELGPNPESFMCTYERVLGLPLDLDAELSRRVLWESLSPAETPSGQAYFIVGAFLAALEQAQLHPGCVTRPLGVGDDPSASRRMLDTVPPELRPHAPPFGWVTTHDENWPGEGYLGVEVSGPVGLACLQRHLDVLGSGIHLVEPAPARDRYNRN